MTVFNTQSDIAEVRDQLSLDYADGKYLNVVSSNLGVQRPPFGFSDDTWRALVKVMSLQHKQIRTKFEAILSIILGPKITQVSALAANCSVGDRHATLVSSAQFPQIGTMVIDAGMATEETVEYCYIDRYSNTVYFSTPLVFDHVAVNQEWETGIISEVPSGGLRFNVFDAAGFPDPTTNDYPLIIGRGTAYEAVAVASSYDVAARWIEGPILSAGGPGVDTAAGLTVTLGSTASQAEVYYLTLDDVSKLPVEKGYLQAALSNALTATAGTVTSVTVTSATADAYGGHWVRFDGNVTAGLANQLAYVTDNTSTVLTFSNTLAFAPAAGDTFSVLANFEYIRASTDDNSVLMKREFPDLQVVPGDLAMTLLRPRMTAAIAQVKVAGVGWEVFQSDPRHVEILLPQELLDSNLRSASYIRDATLNGTAVASFFRALGSTDLAVSTTANMPLIGVLDHDALGFRYAYYTPHAWVTVDALAGDLELTVTDTSQFLPTGTLLVDGSSVIYSVANTTTLTVAALPADVGIGARCQDALRFRLAKETLGDVAALETLDVYGNYAYGDMWSIDDVWAGPYVWDIFAEIHKEQTVPNNSVTQNISGPTFVSVDRLTGATVFELEDASSFSSAVPYNLLLGENSGNVETLAVQEVSLKSRTYTTLTANALPGDTSLAVTALAGPVAPLNTFPNGGPYRIVVAPFTADAEVLEVSSTSALTLNLASPVLLNHLATDRVVLLSDLVRISPAAADEHTGRILSTDRLGLYAKESQFAFADMVRPIYTEITLNLAGTDFNAAAGEAVWNFGDRRNSKRARLTASFSTTTAQLDNTSELPTTGYPYVVYVDVGAGPLMQEVLRVIGNNTGLAQLTLSHAPVFTHAVGRLVEFRPGAEEVISYTSRTGSVLEFDSYLSIQNTHYEAEYLAPTVGTGFPRDDGFDFPLRLPVTVEDRIRFMVDLVRAAGVEVTFVSKR